ncbi:uncharacterized protein [Haliotis cracherodii]|uniref:uncharacterized protein n=1 Tax=Haliotis cracherodii TaxID=6455 RepID=UPI0039EC59BC
MPGKRPTSRVWVVVAVFFFLATLSLAGYILLKEFWFKKSPEQRILERYPNMFLTREQMLQLVNYTSQYKPVYSYIKESYTCNLNCSEGGPRRFGKQSSNFIWHHACCQTQIFYRAEDTMTNVYGHVKRIAQFKNRKQYFKTEQCSHVVNFGYGVCSQNMEYVTAVTVDGDDDDMAAVSGEDHVHYDEDRYQIEWVKVNGSCKCLNRSHLRNANN